MKVKIKLSENDVQEIQEVDELLLECVNYYFRDNKQKKAQIETLEESLKPYEKMVVVEDPQFEDEDGSGGYFEISLLEAYDFYKEKYEELKEDVENLESKNAAQMRTINEQKREKQKEVIDKSFELIKIFGYHQPDPPELEGIYDVLISDKSGFRLEQAEYRGDGEWSKLFVVAWREKTFEEIPTVLVSDFLKSIEEK